MARPRTGSIAALEDGRFLVRVRWTDGEGTRRKAERILPTKRDARAARDRLLKGLEDQGESAVAGDKMTFAVFADFFQARYLVPARYVDGRKVSGRRSLRGIDGQMKALRAFFGRKLLRSIKYSDLESFRDKRLATPKERGKKQRTIASVNRDLALLRRMFSVAVREGWVMRNPFGGGEPLVKLADERRRDRVLTRAEEEALLSVCTEERAHLRPFVIAALDTGLRRGELLALRWGDVSFAEGVVRVAAFNTKTMRERTVALTKRVIAELHSLNPNQAPEAVVFPVRDVKHSFATACRLAKIEALRFHDLRATCATRLASRGVPLHEIGGVLGHTQAQTTARYARPTKEAAHRAAKALDDYRMEVRSTTKKAKERVL